MKKKDFVEGLIEKTEFPNKGTFAFEDREITVKGVIQGQRIAGQVTKLRKGKAVARLVEVLEPSEMEDGIPRCPHFGACGGCFYQTVSYENQLRIKEGQVRELLKDYISDETWEGIKGSPKWWEYRNKMEFSFGDEVKGGRWLLVCIKRIRSTILSTLRTAKLWIMIIICSSPVY